MQFLCSGDFIFWWIYGKIYIVVVILLKFTVSICAYIQTFGENEICAKEINGFPSFIIRGVLAWIMNT